MSFGVDLSDQRMMSLGFGVLSAIVLVVSLRECVLAVARSMVFLDVDNDDRLSFGHG